MSTQEKAKRVKRNDKSGERKKKRAARCRMELHKDVYDRWCHVGTENSFTNNSQIARFLLDRYESTQTTAHCMHCLAPIKLICSQCKLHLQELASQTGHSVSTPSVDVNSPKTDLTSAGHRTWPCAADKIKTEPEAGCSCEEELVTEGFKESCKVENNTWKEIKSDNIEQNLGTGKLEIVEIKSDPVGPDSTDEAEGGDLDEVNDDNPAVSLQGFVLDLSDVRNGQVFCRNTNDALTVPGPANALELGDSNCDIENCKTKKQKRIKFKLNHWLCEDCGDTFSRADTFKFHQMSHTDCRPHACEHCDMRFRLKSHLVNHIRTHKDDRPYVCETCACGFKQLASLCRHRLIHTGVRPYACRQCQASFTRRSHLQRHMQVHTTARPFLCETCESAFKDQRTLQKHMLTHLQQTRQFICKECGSSFTMAGNLQRHLKTHIGIRPFVCMECDRAFSRRNHLARHMQTAHNMVIPLERTHSLNPHE